MTTGFDPQYKVVDAINEVIRKYRSGEMVEPDESYRVKWMKRLDLHK